MKHVLFLIAFLLPVTLAAQELPLGSPMPLADQSFTGVDGSAATLGSLAGSKGTVVVFWSNKCAWVDRYEARLLELAEQFGSQGYRFVLVNSFNASDENESAARSAARAGEKGYRMPYVADANGALAKALGAVRAPQVFVFDANRSLAYVGAIDDSPSAAASAQNRFLFDALTAGAAGRTPATTRTEALGCLIRF